VRYVSCAIRQGRARETNAAMAAGIVERNLRPAQTTAMSKVPFLPVAILFAAKVDPGEPDSALCLIAMLGLALGGLSPWPFRSVALTGAGIIAFSYVHLVVAGILAGWIASIICKRNERHDATAITTSTK